MKKLIMASLAVAMGTMAFGTGTDVKPTVKKTASSNVKVTAQVVADNLIISDLNGRPLVLDFGKISTVSNQERFNAKVDYKITKIGTGTDSLTDVTVALSGIDGANKVKLQNVNAAADANNKTIDATIELLGKGGKFEGSTYTGAIQGTIMGKDLTDKEASTYENVVILTATASETPVPGTGVTK